jgi:UDP-glucuronate 4-epimerase
VRSTILVTGAAGFIGYHTCARLLSQGVEVIGIDNINDYYDVRLKRDRLKRIQSARGFTFWERDITHSESIQEVFDTSNIYQVIHLAAQPGVRYSLKNPRAYVETNIAGFVNILEGCRNHNIKHLVYASSSSVYGANSALPYSTHQNVDHPLSLYAATKKANELLAHSYSHLFGLPTTGLRFFTVYGPWGRPDMAVALFAKAIFEGKPIDMFNGGNLRRDFTYIDDIVEGIVRISAVIPGRDPGWDSSRPDPASSSAPYKIYNIGNSQPVEVNKLIEYLEDVIGRKAIKHHVAMQPGDVNSTSADVRELEEAIGFRPSVPLSQGICDYIAWYRDYYSV